MSSILKVLGGIVAELSLLAGMTWPAAMAQDESAPRKLEVGQHAPAFTAETTDGKKIGLADFRDKSAVLLVFYSDH